MDLCGTAILPLQFAAKEAWMSIMPRHRIAAGLRIGKSRTVSVGRLAVSLDVSWRSLPHNLLLMSENSPYDKVSAKLFGEVRSQ